MEQTELIPNNKIEKCDAGKAFHIITGNYLPKGWGFRHLFVGYSGCGKSYANQALFEFVKRYNVACIATDQKSQITEYPAKTAITTETELSGVEDLRAGVVVRGFGAHLEPSEYINFDVLARDCFRLGKAGVKTGLFIDELADACSGERTWAKPGKSGVSWMNLAYKQGREIGLSISACTQLPQENPRAAFRLSDTTGFFRQEGGELRYLESLELIDSKEAEIIRNLADYEFFLYQRGNPIRYICKI